MRLHEEAANLGMDARGLGRIGRGGCGCSVGGAGWVAEASEEWEGWADGVASEDACVLAVSGV